jgi:L-aspartate oxidase
MRYSVNFNLNELRKIECDVVIVGSGISGIYTALNLNIEKKVIMVTKSTVVESNSYLAQGGIAVTVDSSQIQSHIQDSLMAGNYLNDMDALKVMIEEGSENLRRLIELGVDFDRDNNNNLLFTREAAHSINRIVHFKDITGKAVIDGLNKELINRTNIDVLENTYFVDVVTQNEGVIGIIILIDNELVFVRTSNVVLASGGIGQLYTRTTNSKIATGDGIAAAYRAGAKLRDLEFIQFHPSAINIKDESFLISEAVRGEGGIIRNEAREAFMKNYHELGDLAPRDVVSRSILKEQMRQGSDQIYIDVTHLEEGFFSSRFPNIHKFCIDHGIDPLKELIPISPAEHYFMGGIKTDLDGRTSIKGLFACGETASTRVHGANRLASNSLLEAMVFSHRVANTINSNYINTDCEEMVYKRNTFAIMDYQNDLNTLKEHMNIYVSVLKRTTKLVEVREQIDEMLRKYEYVYNLDVKFLEFKNMMYVSKLIVESALKRKESVGAHYVED